MKRSPVPAHRRPAVVVALAAFLLCSGASCAQAAAADPQGAPLAAVSSATDAERGGRLPTSIPLRREADNGSGPHDVAWWPVGLGAIGVAVLLAGIGPLRRRLPGAAPARDVILLSATRLTPRNSIHLVEWHGRQLLIGCSDRSTVLLAEAAVVTQPAGTPAAGPVTSPSSERVA